MRDRNKVGERERERVRERVGESGREWESERVRVRKPLRTTKEPALVFHRTSLGGRHQHLYVIGLQGAKN